MTSVSRGKSHFFRSIACLAALWCGSGVFTTARSAPCVSDQSHPLHENVFNEEIHQQFDNQVVGFAFVLADKCGIVGTNFGKAEGGWAQRPGDGNIAMKTTVRSNIGSVTKVLSAIGLLNLFDKHVFSPSSVQDQLDLQIDPQFPARWRDLVATRNKAITYRRILEHKSDIPNTIVDNKTNAAPAVARFTDGNGNTQLFMALKRAGDTANRIDVRAFDNISWLNRTKTLASNTPKAPKLAAFDGALYMAFVANDSSHAIFIRTLGRVGGKWSREKRLQDRSDVAPALAAYGGRLYLAYKIEDGTNRIAVKSMDKDGTWARVKTLASNTPTSPALARYNDRLYMAFRANDSSNRIFVRWLDSTGRWSPEKELLDSTTAGPALAAYGGKLYMAYKANNATHHIFTRTLGRNDRWGARKELGSATSTTPALAAFRGYLYLLYKSDGDNRILLRRLKTDTWSQAFGRIYKRPEGLLKMYYLLTQNPSTAKDISSAVRYYSNFNIALLTYLIPKIRYTNKYQKLEQKYKNNSLIDYVGKMRLSTGKLFEKYMAEEIFPKSLGDIHPTCDPRASDGVAKSYSDVNDADGIVNSEVVGNGSCRAQGGYYMSAEELANFARTFEFTNTFIGPTTRSKLYDPAEPKNVIVYNSIISTTKSPGFTEAWPWKCGGAGGSWAALVRLPYGYVGVGLANSNKTGSKSTCTSMAQAIIDAFYDATK